MGNRRTPPSSLVEYVDDLLDELRRRLPQALHHFDVEAIHKSRVATRRLRAAMDLLKPLLPAGQRRPLVRAARRLRRRLGPLRDLDVMLAHLQRIRGRRHAPAVTWANQRLQEQRESARAKATKKNPFGKILSRLDTWLTLREQVLRSQDALPALLRDSVNRQLSDFAQRADLTGRKIIAPRNRADAQDPHELRIAAKRLRYTLELARAHGCALDPQLARLFKKMQDALGLWHDFVVLSGRISELALEAELALHDPPLHAAVLDLARFTYVRAQRELDKFARLWAESGDMIVTSLRETFAPGAQRREDRDQPQLFTEPQTGPGPSGSPEPQAPPDDRADSEQAA